MVIDYDNMRVYKKILDHLMRDLKLSERRMWRRSDGMCVVQHNRDKRDNNSNISLRNTWT